MATYKTGGFSPLRLLMRPARGLFIAIFHYLDQHPLAMRALHVCLRARPVWRIGHSVIVTGDAQVVEALQRDDDFPLPDERAEKFLHGAFVLGMTRTPQFDLERAELKTVMPARDEGRVQRLCEVSSADAIGRVASGRSLDVVTDLSTPVGQFLIINYFGIPAAYLDDPNPLRFIDDLRQLGAMIASPNSLLPGFRAEAEAAAVRVFAHVDREVREAEENILTGVPVADTVLTRLVFRRLQRGSGLNRDAVRRNIIGVLLPGVALVNRAFATAVVQLLKRKPLRDALRIARAQNGAARQDTLQKCLLEAMRFHPVFPVMPRHCPHETVLRGFRRIYRIRPGRDVFLSVASAMFDPRGALFDTPGGGYPPQARLRNRDAYRHFGGGIHECLGQHIALPQMGAMLEALLQLDNLRVARGIEYHPDDGISPMSLELTFTPDPAGGQPASVAVVQTPAAVPAQAPVGAAVQPPRPAQVKTPADPAVMANSPSDEVTASR